MLPKGFGSARNRIASLSLFGAGATVTMLHVTVGAVLPVLPVAVCVYTIAELAFAVVFTARRKRLEQLPVEQQTSVGQAWLTFNRVQDTLRTLDFGGASHSSSNAAWLLEWFVEDDNLSVVSKHPHHDNIAELLAEAFFCSSWSVHQCSNAESRQRQCSLAVVFSCDSVENVVRLALNSQLMKVVSIAWRDIDGIISCAQLS